MDSSAAASADSAQPTPIFPALADRRTLRFAAILLLYFMQGVPLGLFTIGMPAWLSANGASPAVVGSFVAIVGLPWSLKLVNGFLMDRFAFRPMGRRRGWILGAQAMMVVILLAFALLEPQASDIPLLMALGFAMNLCATFNDVAVDGMTIDIVPDNERTLINSLMFGSQALGYAAIGFVAGQLLAADHIVTLGLVLAAFVALASIFVGCFRERAGERLLPWTSGCASAECEARQQNAWMPILRGVFRALLRPTTLFFLLAFAISQAALGFTDAVAPSLAVQILGWSSAQFSNFASGVSLAAAIAGMLLTPIFVRLAGLRNTAIGLLAIILTAALLGGLTFDTWRGDRIFQIIGIAMFVSSIMLIIVSIIWSMRICDPLVAASQFALFMAIPNLSRSALSGLWGWVAENGGYALVLYAVAAASLLAMLLFLLARIGREDAIPPAACPS